MAKDYSNMGNSPYSKLLSRDGDLMYQFGGQQIPGQNQQGGTGTGSDDGTTQTKGGSVATVALKNEGNATDVWIKSFIRSVNWKPKTVGFYINGATGYAEFANIFVSGSAVIASGTIGGFQIGPNYIKDSIDSMGMSSVVGPGEVRFWSGETFSNRNTAPFRVLSDGSVYSNNITVTGGTIDASTIVYSTGPADPLITPSYIGQMYINTVGERFFLAIGTTDFNDWMLVSAIRLTRYTDNSDTVAVSENVSTRTRSYLDYYDDINVNEDITLAVI